MDRTNCFCSSSRSQGPFDASPFDYLAAAASSTGKPENPLSQDPSGVFPSDSTAVASSSTGRPENAFNEIMDPLASTSTTLKKRPYDVFINHRGPDVKNTLASSIYHSLDLVRIKAFFDREETDLGDLIPQSIHDAISSALIHIAIFSKEFARSPWCLAELSFMVETRATIIPVFYDVEPSDVRWPAGGMYAEAFREHEAKGRHNSEMLERWKKALHKASFYSGYEFKSNDDFGLLLKSIVRRVQQEMKSVKVPFKVADFPVGLDDAVRGFEGVRPAGVNGDAQIVGIAGMGGSGKTTLARELYNRNIEAYDKYSFLSDVREAALQNLQKKLLEDLLNLTDIPFNDPNEGKTILAGRFKFLSSRVLIVLDDVDHVDQLDALLPEHGKSLGSDSLVIVTTRDTGVLRSWDIFSVYKMTTMEPRHAKELFCWHAFKRRCPPAAFVGLVQEFIDACKSLPLSLKVIGGMLYTRNAEEWKSQLAKILRSLPFEINKTLRLSYDALDDEEKNIFLDVACFFVGEKKNLAIAIWDAAEWSGLESLVDKCLVEVDKQNRIRMHNHLRDLGREIANNCPLHRLWSRNQITNIMRYCKQDIRGIMAATTKFTARSAYREFPICLDTCPPCFEKCMDRSFWIFLQLLVVAGNNFTSEFFDKLTGNLVWLRWFDFQHTELPSLKNLRVLELYGASQLQLWENNAHPPKELREIIITARKGNIFHRFPSNITGLEHLRKLALISYDGNEFCFTNLPDEFCHLQSLEQLELRHCKLLSTLPTRFGELRKLKHLDLCSCEMIRKLPDSFRLLVNLEYLDLSDCKKLSPVPDILENMEMLKILHFSGQPKLQELPRQILEQKSMRELYLRNTRLIDVPNDIDKLGKLETLVIGSPLLTGLPTSLGNLSNLTRLKIIECRKLEYLPESLGSLKLLARLCIKSSGVKFLPEGFRQLTSLQYLKIIDCPIAELDFGPGSSYSFCKLKVIRLKGTDVTRFSISHGCCANLETLQIEQNYSLMELGTLPKSVKTLNVANSPNLVRVYERRSEKRKQANV